MVKRSDIKRCEEVAKKYGATKLVLFGSAVDDMENARDIDLICEGVPDEVFIQMSAEMMQEISVPLDIFSTNPMTRFIEINLDYGKVLYEK